MKIERYELTNFGSWGHVVYEPGDARLCIVSGENGTGKSTLVSEALGYALYRDFRGSVNGPVRLSSTDCSVSIEFSLNGDHYRAIRRRTTRGAGKSSADLQVQNETGWIPVASGDKEVPAEVRDLLRMDAATFRTSVSLAQSDLKRFVDATAGDRERILAAIVVDPRFAPASELAAKRARDLEATLAGDRSHLLRTSDAIEVLEPVRAELVRCRADAASIDGILAEQAAARSAAEVEIAALLERQAVAATKAAEIDRVEQEIAGLTERYRATKARHEASCEAIEAAGRTLAEARSVAAAAARLLELRADVDRLVAAATEDRRAASEIDTKRRALDELRRGHAETVRAWTAQADPLRARIATLTDEAHHAEHVTCPKCQHVFPAGADRIRTSIEAARVGLQDLGEQPPEPTHTAREAAVLVRLETRRRELAFDPVALTDAHRQVAALERMAARGEAMATALATLEREQASVVVAAAELADISTAGQAARTRLSELNAAASEQAELGRAVTEARGGLAVIVETVERTDAERRELDRRIAGHETSVARLEELIAERDEIAGRLAEVDVMLGRLRHLAARFGLRGIPARVIESVLPELTAYANDVLGALFGLRLDIRATRSSADGKAVIEALDLVITKDDVGEVELARASGGQGTAIALALALGLSRLNARRAGTAIRSWVVDEPEGLDVIRLKALGAYLRDLLHRGELDRVFVITHTTELTEFGDRVDEVREGPDGAYLEQVA